MQKALLLPLPSLRLATSNGVSSYKASTAWQMLFFALVLGSTSSQGKEKLKLKKKKKNDREWHFSLAL